MENLNAEQIKKALERDIRISIDLNYECPRITYSKLRDALALINSQEQRIKELGEENERLMRDKTAMECIIATARNRAKADTVRKIANLLWQGESEKLNISVGGKYYEKQEFIDQIAKEMLESEE